MDGLHTSVGQQDTQVGFGYIGYWMYWILDIWILDIWIKGKTIAMMNIRKDMGGLVPTGAGKSAVMDQT